MRNIMIAAKEDKRIQEQILKLKSKVESTTKFKPDKSADSIQTFKESAPLKFDGPLVNILETTNIKAPTWVPSAP